jgi:choline dehydrogenase
MYYGNEELPGAAKLSDAELIEFARNYGTSCYHLVGTCRMGSAGDPTAVVDDHLRVRGIENLRVVDASVMPTVTSGNTYAPTLMIAAKAADLILGRPAKPRLELVPAGTQGAAAEPLTC